MQGKSLYLVVGALLAAGVAFLVSQSRAPQTELATDEALVPGLADGLNDVTRIEITGPGDTPRVTLVRGEQQWGVEQRGGYAANTGDIRKLLIELGDARLVEQKTSREENYAALGVEAVSADNAGGVQISVTGVGDVAPVIVGKATRNSGAVYVRRASEAVSWVANKRLRIEQDPAKWLLKDLVDINAPRVQSIRIEHPDGEVFAATRGEVNFDVANVPEGAALSSPSAADELARVFDDLRFNDVIAAADFAPGDAPTTKVTYVTSDGLSLDAGVVAANDKFYLTLNAEAVPADPAQFAADAEPAEGEAPQPTPEQKAAAMFEAMTAESARINARVDGWVYEIPMFKYQQLTRRVADLLDKSDSEAVGPN